MLLVFFLMTTNMDSDKGLQRQLPPVDPDEEEVVASVDQDNVLQLTVAHDGTVLFQDQPLLLGAVRQKVVDFVEHCPNRATHAIYISVDQRCRYEAYFNVQNEVIAAYNLMRDRQAVSRYGKKYEQCTKDEQKLLRSLFPQRLCETYPPVVQEGGGI